MDCTVYNKLSKNWIGMVIEDYLNLLEKEINLSILKRKISKL